MQKARSTEEIKELLVKAKINFDWAVNQALNAYLPKLIFSCPFTEQPCSSQQCIGCEEAKQNES
jgi:hypothetical protein